MIYFKGKTNDMPAGFYHSESHGARRIMVVDPDWVRPLVDGEPDESAVAPLIEMDNPDCRIPEDAVPISEALYESLLLAPSRSKEVVIGPDGLPMEADPQVSPEEAVAAERVWRDGQLASTDGVISRHRDEVEGGAATTLTPEQYIALQQYRQALRNWPEYGEFPLIDHRPPAPYWLAENL